MEEIHKEILTIYIPPRTSRLVIFPFFFFNQPQANSQKYFIILHSPIKLKDVSDLDPKKM